MKISMLTLGCKVNQYEADSLATDLKKRGHEVTHGLEPADVYILSTCAVTNEAERKSRQMVSKINKLAPNAKIIVCGCASQNNAQNFIGKPNVSLVLGTSSKAWVPDLIEREGNYVMEPAFDYEETSPPRKNRTRTYVKVQDGCDNYCSYCLIPYVRGRSRSRALENVVTEVFNLAKFSKEIVLTGINLSEWGKDFKMDLGNLLSSVANVRARIRLSSLEVNVVTPELIKVMKDMPNFCDHFHLSLQSASDNVLKRMNRRYTFEEYKKKVALLRDAFPNGAITTDVIVGFPEETDEDFEEAMTNIESIGFADMHIFPYSRREGTVAAGLKSQVPPEVVSKRIERLNALRDRMAAEFLKTQKGKPAEVLLEQEKEGYFVGHARNYTKVYVPVANLQSNTSVLVSIGGAFRDGVLGDFIQTVE